MSKQYNIDSVTSNKIILQSIYGNASDIFNAPINYPDVEFDVRASTGNNGRYKVISAAFVGGKTEITVNGTVPSSIGDGYITNTTSYILNGTDLSNPFVLHPTQSNNYVNTSLKFSGRNNANWGEDIQQNLLNLLDNFSNSTPPINPVRGQKWFDTTINKLKIYDGSTWLIIATSINSYAHIQNLPSASWSINHNLNSQNIVYNVYVDTGGPNLVPIIPDDIVFVDTNNIIVEFSSAYEGKIVIISA